MSDKLNAKLSKCIGIIRGGYESSTNTGLVWLDFFCDEFLKYTTCLHALMESELAKNCIGDNEKVDTVFLCLTQIVICIRQMEQVIKAEESGGFAIPVSREYFLDRLHWCLDTLLDITTGLFDKSKGKQIKQFEQNTFVELMDLALARLAPYCAYTEENSLHIAKENAEAMLASQQIRTMINFILSHTLAFANVALQEDKRALSALCQKVLRECMSFQEECEIIKPGTKSNRKLKAISLEHALYQLEDYINEALLRLVFVCFLDFEKYSIEKLRTVMCLSHPDDSALDELIADFDVNLDRTTQIGIFAIAFATNPKIKSVLRSCLASFESLDSYIIPSLQTSTSDIHSEILEQHFNEEVANFKRAMQEIIDSYAFIACYYEIITERLREMEKKFNKMHLQEVVQMGEFLYEHFQLKVNAEELCKVAERQDYFDKFTLILNECKAILMCVDQVDEQRVLKRFKILRSVTQKFMQSLHESSAKFQNNQSNALSLPNDELNESQYALESNGISPSVCSILYIRSSKHNPQGEESLQGNYSKLSQIKRERNNASMLQARIGNDANSKKSKHQHGRPGHACTIRRKESLRTAMFKRQKSEDVGKACTMYTNSTSLQISDILNQLVDMSSRFTNNVTQHNETIVL